MLTPDELSKALTEAQKAAGVCKPWCRVVSTTEGGTYALAHNGAGSRDTDTPRIHNPAMTGLSKDGLTEKLRAWIVDLHAGNRIDLNATMATGGLICGSGRPHLVGSVGPEFWTTCYRLDHLHLHREGSCSVAS